MSAPSLNPQPSTFVCGVCGGVLLWHPLFGLYWCDKCDQWRSGADDHGEAEQDMRESLETLIECFGWQHVHEVLQSLKAEN